MKTQIILVDHLGKRYDVPHCSVKLDFYRRRRASKLSVCAVSNEFYPNNGNRVIFIVDDKTMFDGFIFSIDTYKDTVSFYCYDRLRYLLYKDSYVFYDKTLSDIVRYITKEKGFKTGRIDVSLKKIPEVIADNICILSIIESAIEENQKLCGDNFVFYDNNGYCCLENCNNLNIYNNLYYNSNILAFERKMEIDSDSYNKVKLFKADGKGNNTVYTLSDPSSIKSYGVLQYTGRINTDMNDYQAKNQAKNILESHKEASISLDITAIGDTAFRAGFTCKAQFKKEDKLRKYLIDEAHHDFKNGQHTMRLHLIR